VGEVKQVGAEDFERFNGQLASLLKCGMPLVPALEQAASVPESREFRGIVADITKAVTAGERLDSAVERHAARFPPGYLAVLRAGLQAGDLARALFIAARSSRQLSALQRTIGRVLAYPAVVLACLEVYLCVLLFGSYPAFRQIIPEIAGYNIPGMMLGLNALGVFFVGMLALTSLFLVFAMKGAVGWWRGRTTAFLPPLLVRVVPFAGMWTRRWHATVFLRHLLSVVKAGVPYATALKTSSTIVGDIEVARQVGSCVAAIEGGTNFREAVARLEFLPSAVRTLMVTKADDEAVHGILDTMVDGYEADLKRFGRMMGESIQVAAIALVGMMVGSVYLGFWILYLIAIGTLGV